MFFEKRMTEIVHGLLTDYVHEGDIAVDATMGNGFDTEKLCEQVGASGHVYAFDIQEKAIENTRKRLEEQGVSDRASLILDSHACMADYVREEIAAFVFNLGYLPEGDHEIVTEMHSTLEALQTALALLRSGGIGILVAYYGHEGGLLEKDGVDDFLKALSAKQYDVLKLENHNRRRTPPILYMIKRIKK